MHEQPTDYPTNDLFPIGRRRKPNFTDNEVLTIISQYEMYKEILHSREASKTVIAQKQAIWKRITETLNASYPLVDRTVEDVRRKWKKLQSEAKRESAAQRQAHLSGNSTSIWSKPNNIHERILNICRPSISSSTSNSHYSQRVHVQPQQLGGQTNHDSDGAFNEQSSDKIDSPSSDLANGVHAQLDSPGEESTSPILDQEENVSSPLINLSTPSMNNQVSKRTLDKRRKLLKTSANVTPTIPMMKSSGQSYQNSLRYESLMKRKRTLELTSQKIYHDRECLLIERKNIEIKLAANECENERINIEKRRTELVLQKYHNDLPVSSNGTNHHHHHHHQGQLSDQEDHDDNNSVDDISDLND